MSNSTRTGTAGERIAREYLRSQGYTIVDRNWSTTVGELDIVAKHDDLLVFVEVKTRRGFSTESALASVTAVKHERTLKAVYQYLHEHNLDVESGWRIDVIAVAIDGSRRARIDHVEDAFDW